MEEYTDIIQIGARNMHNYSLLRRAGHTSKPVLLKRSFAGTIDELPMSAEYIMSEGNRQIILCERGIRTFADNTRNTLDLSAIPAIKEVSHLPIIVDPSHAAGKRDYVIPLSKGFIYSEGFASTTMQVSVITRPMIRSGNRELLRINPIAP